MSDDLIEQLRNFTEDDAYATPWTFGEVVHEAADEIARLRAEVERLTAALAEERERADALAANVRAAAACLDLLPATAIACGADEKTIEAAKSAEDYAETVDGLISALAQHRARRQG